MRSSFTIDGRELIHRGVDPWTGERFCRRYWLPLVGGYVWLDDSRNGDRPGSLGRQPTDADGSTWRCRDMAALARKVRADWRVTLRDYKRA